MTHTGVHSKSILFTLSRLHNSIGRPSVVSLQQNDLICYDHTTKDLLTLVKNSDADLSNGISGALSQSSRLSPVQVAQKCGQVHHNAV